MNKWKKIMKNCPYLSALLATWSFMTLGSIGLMIYRDYGRPNETEIISNPLFAIIMEEEMNGAVYNINDKSASDGDSDGETDTALNDNNISDVIQSVSDNDINEDEKLISSDKSNEGKETEESDVQQSEAEGSDAEEAAKKAGKTTFVSYTPVETDSVYYSDAGRFALTTEYDYAKVEEDYFKDAVFIGDSRTLGIADYAGIDADFYCESGMTIYKLLSEKGVKNPKTGEKANLSEVLQHKSYGKIYIMLGMNELGYGNTNGFFEKYKEVVEQLRNWQPQAVIFIMANLHISQEKNNNATEFNNINVNDKNAAIANLADGINIFYIDCNPLFVDEGGFLKSDLTFDGVHLYAKCYSIWRDFLMEHGVKKDEQ